MKTLNEFENEVAIEYGFNGINEVWQLAIRHKAFENAQKYLSEAAERYAAYMCQEAIKQERYRIVELLPEVIKTTLVIRNPESIEWVIKKIINAPSPTYKDK